jgi:ribosomal protein S18 acetylase RimI-like enzyme
MEYKVGTIPELEQILSLYKSSGIRRPIADETRIQNMYGHSNLVVTAWDGASLVGIARSLTDYCYACYLSDLAVEKAYQGAGVGKKLVEITLEAIGDQTSLILLSAPSAIGYYPRLGFEKIENGFIIHRKA